MLREPSGRLASVAERQERFDLGELKEELGIAMGLNTEAPGSALAFLRRGYKVKLPMQAGWSPCHAGVIARSSPDSTAWAVQLASAASTCQNDLRLRTPWRQLWVVWAASAGSLLRS